MELACSMGRWEREGALGMLLHTGVQPERQDGARHPEKRDANMGEMLSGTLWESVPH